MRLPWLKPNCRGLLIFTSIVILLSILFLLFGVMSISRQTLNPANGTSLEISTENHYNWRFLGILALVVVVCYPISMYFGGIFKSQSAPFWLAILTRTIIFVPAYLGFVFVAFFDIHLAYFSGFLFYFILGAVISTPMIVLLAAKFRRSQPTLLKVAGIVILGLVCVASVKICVARPMVLLCYVVFALPLSLPLFALINIPFSRITLILYVLLLSGLVIVSSVPWTSRHRFLRDLSRIRAGRYLDRSDPGMIVIDMRRGQGMTFADVEHIMQGYTLMVGGKWYRPTKQHYKPKIAFKADYVPDVNERGEVSIIDGRASYRHSGAAHFNADFGWVDFQRGKVVRVRFLPD